MSPLDNLLQQPTLQYIISIFSTFSTFFTFIFGEVFKNFFRTLFDNISRNVKFKSEGKFQIRCKINDLVLETQNVALGNIEKDNFIKSFEDVMRELECRKPFLRAGYFDAASEFCRKCACKVTQHIGALDALRQLHKCGALDSKACEYLLTINREFRDFCDSDILALKERLERKSHFLWF